VAPALRDLPNCELVAVARGGARHAESFAREFGAGRWSERWEDLIADEEIDAIYVATPVYLHAAQTIAAAEAGKHVLCEKPMAISVGECDRMIEACRANNVKLGIAYYRHFYPIIARIKEILASGEIGTPAVAQINAFEWFDPGPDHPRRWLLDKKQSGGGPMFDFGCHRIEVLMNLFGTVIDTKCSLSNVLFEREVEDTAVAVLRFAAGPSAVVTVTHAARERQDSLDIFGSRGSLHVPILNKGEMLIRIGDDERTESYSMDENVHRPLIDDFVRAMRSGVAPAVTGEMGFEVARIEQAMYGG
jgi:predicted dehydrogenase